MNTTRKNLARLGTAGALSLGLVVAGATSASAHVTITPTTTAAGAYSVLTFSVGHGCDGSPTTAIRIQVPEEIVTVTPTLNPGWDVDKVMETLDEPVDDGHGGQYTERVDEVVYAAKEPLADGYRDAFEVSLKLPEAEGERLVFPVVQECEDGETAWIQTTPEGGEEPESPAPFVDITAAAEGDGHGHGSDAAESDEAADDADGGSDALGWVGVGLGAIGLVAGGTALARTRKTS